ncbi:MAG: SGNH/GDSL hydrolase family protein [Planctomycetes bacterium]|nr:SGNH/GDSL hydrolase family protein [Planctomycetota bacterium]
MRLTFAILVLTLAWPTTAPAQDKFLLKDGERVVFLGDSNTFAGRFITYLDAYLCTRYPTMRFELINLGLPSETVSGLSEADHPYPRPDVHTRLDRALELTKPNVVVVCYGMNDGIYSPFSEERFKKYQDGVKKFIEKCEKAGARVILMTPAPFESQAVKNKVIPKGAEKYSYQKPYEKYDEEVLTVYSNWLVEFGKKNNYPVIDAHAAVLAHLERMRKVVPDYRVSGDGIHPDVNGHLEIFRRVLETLNAKIKETQIAIAPGKSTDTETSFTLDAFQLLPRDPKWTSNLSDVRLTFPGRQGKHTLMEGDKKLGEFTGEQLAAGIDLGSLVTFSASVRAAEAWKLLEEKNRIMGLAWLTHVGHKRPGTPVGLPFEEARKKEKSLEEEIRKLCKPTDYKLRLVKLP